jgi:hypothetical protein
VVQLEEVHPNVVGNFHMAFMEHEKERKEDDPNTTYATSHVSPFVC